MGEVRVLVSVGTDHHQFDRLIELVDDWVAGRDDVVDYVVQHGSSIPSNLATNLDIVSRDLLLQLLEKANVVVVQAGPGSILDARAMGRLPVAVPRIAARGEVVDDHQVDFAKEMAAKGEAILAMDKAVLHVALDRIAADPAGNAKPQSPSPLPGTAAAIRAELERIAAQPPGRVRLRRMLHVARGVFGSVRGGRGSGRASSQFRG